MQNYSARAPALIIPPIEQAPIITDTEPLAPETENKFRSALDNCDTQELGNLIQSGLDIHKSLIAKQTPLYYALNQLKLVLARVSRNGHEIPEYAIADQVRLLEYLIINTRIDVNNMREYFTPIKFVLSIFTNRCIALLPATFARIMHLVDIMLAHGAQPSQLEQEAIDELRRRLREQPISTNRLAAAACASPVLTTQ